MTQKIVLVDSPRLSPKPRARVLVEDEEGAPSEEPNEGPLPQLPLEVLELVMDHLDSVQDFCNVAQVCQEWRFLICTVDTCWQKAFLRDHGELNADSYASIATWRGKYM